MPPHFQVVPHLDAILRAHFSGHTSGTSAMATPQRSARNTAIIIPRYEVEGLRNAR